VVTVQSQLAGPPGWIAKSDSFDSHFDRILDHPRFADAARLFARKTVERMVPDPALDAIRMDGGRFVAGCWAMALHADGGLTLPRFKEKCASSGLMSAGRARTLLQFFQHVGYVDAIGAERAGAAVRYAPTETFLAAWVTIMQPSLEAASLIEPSVRPVLSRIGRPDVLTCFMSHVAGSFLAAAVPAPESPFERAFISPAAGLQFVDLVLAAADEDDDVPPRRSFAVSLNASAKRLRVSRAHVRRLLAGAESEGLLTGNGAGRMSFTEDGRRYIRHVLAFRLYGLISCAERTMKDIALP
jgi:hypothetical protein